MDDDEDRSPVSRSVPKTVAEYRSLNKSKILAKAAPLYSPEGLHSLCQTHLENWKDVKLSELEISSISGGLTNRLWKISLLEQVVQTVQPRVVLLRIFGIGTEEFLDRGKESTIFKFLSDLGFSPKMFAEWKEGRFEEFIDAQTLKTKHLRIPDISAKIAQKVGVLHQLQIPGISKEPMLRPLISGWIDHAKKSLEVLKVKLKNDSWRQLKLRCFDMEFLQSESEQLIDKLEKVGSPICFCHNDLLAGNILHVKRTGEIFIIDYEYGGFNYRGFDFGNHFAENMVHYNVNSYPCFYLVPDDYPTKKQQFLFFRNYLQAQGILQVQKEELEKMYTEARLFSMASHFVWSCWAIVQESLSDIDFGFMEFAICRLDQYFQLKKKLWKKINSIN